MDNIRIKYAIIAFNYTESTICLAKYIAKMGFQVDYFLITDLVHDNGEKLGVEYKNAPKRIGLTKLTSYMAPKLLEYGNDLPVDWYLLRIFWFSPKARFINAPIWKHCLNTIRKKKYQAIEIVGHHPWVSIIHNALKEENICHTLHEVGQHQNTQDSTPFIELLIKDKSKIIIHSDSIYQKIISIKGADHTLCNVIPFGKFETNLLYVNESKMYIPLDMSKITFLFYGFIKPYKGLDILLAAISNLKSVQNRFNVIIAGGGSDTTLDFFKKLDNCYVINRYLTADEMIKLNRLCSVVVLPYHTASQTGIISTSFLCEKPVIATSVGAFPENVEDGYNGILVAPENPEAFAAAMRKCIDDIPYVQKLSEGTRSYGVGDKYDWNIIAKQHLNVYGI